MALPVGRLALDDSVRKKAAVLDVAGGAATAALRNAGGGLFEDRSRASGLAFPSRPFTAFGVGTLSLGVQTTDRRGLRVLGRQHEAVDAQEAFAAERCDVVVATDGEAVIIAPV